MISLDDPWMLRRFAFAAFPALIFYSIYFLNRFFHNKKLLYCAFLTLAAANAFLSCAFITRPENKELLPQIEKISERFGSRDLVLVDRMATDSGWSLMSEPLSSIYGKNAVYFFNADDLETIDQSRYEHIYLIAPPAERKSWYYNLIAKKSFDTVTIENNYYEPSKGFLDLAMNIKSTSLAGIWKIK